MANNIRDIHNRITSTKKTAKITKAMNMVSASKLRLAEKAIKEYRPFIDKAYDIIINIASSSEELNHALLEAREVKKTCYVVISSDRGLAGAFNANVLKKLADIISKHQPNEYCVLPLGLKAYSYCQKHRYPMLIDKPVLLRDDIEFNDVYNVTKTLVMNFLQKSIDKVDIIYNHYINTLVHETTVTTVFPINKAQILSDKKTESFYEFEGGVNEVLNVVLPMYIENYIYGLILDSKASEHASRMNSMKNATDNAEEVINSLGLLYNRARQAAITLELTDIVGGASVINEN